jgi:hypothetical protein
MSKDLYSNTREEASLKGSRVYNDGQPCIHGHFPAIRLTKTGICILCDKQKGHTREKDNCESEKQREKRERDEIIKQIHETTKCFYWFTFPDGSQQLFGPFASAYGSARSLSNKWKLYYNYPLPNFNQNDYRY